MEKDDRAGRSKKKQKGSGRTRRSAQEAASDVSMPAYCHTVDCSQGVVTNEVRDRFLVEAMGWKHWNSIGDKHYYIPPDFVPRDPELMPDFSTWAGLGLLWEWAEKQKWFSDLFCEAGGGDLGIKKFGGALLLVDSRHIHPDRFADIIYGFLKEKSFGS